MREEAGESAPCVQACLGAAGYVSKMLGVSRATLYNYLQRIRTDQVFARAEPSKMP